MRTTLLLALITCSVSSAAQSWCTPGATWTYEAGMFLAGYLRFSYRADTLVDGYSAQVIDRYRAVQYPQPTQPVYSGPPVITYTPVAVITRFSDDVVYTFSPSGWDTLYWFGAAPGQGWTMAHMDNPDCEPFLVVDTGTVVIDGVPLRWLDFDASPRVYERIGSVWDMFMYCPNLVVDGPMGMRCYSDDEITYPNASVNCMALVGVDEVSSVKEPMLFPNPGTDQFTLSLPPGPHTLALFDATGRCVLHQRTNESQPTISTFHLAPGLYHARVDDGPAMRWVKE